MRPSGTRYRLPYFDCLLVLLGCCVSCSYGDHGRAISWCFCWLFASGTQSMLLYSVIVMLMMMKTMDFKMFLVYQLKTSIYSAKIIRTWSLEINTTTERQ